VGAKKTTAATFDVRSKMTGFGEGFSEHVGTTRQQTGQQE
jgi:hypothetical protein